MTSNQAAAVYDFLKRHKGEAWCDRCIDANIDYTSQTTTKSIDLIPGYRGARGKCFECGATRKTSVFVGCAVR